MRTHTIGLAAALLVLASACDGDGLGYHGCQVISQGNNWSTYGARLEHDDRRQCPIPIEYPGEVVYSGGDVIDDGAADLGYGELTVRNSAGRLAGPGTDVRAFQTDPYYGDRYVSLFSSYRAATGTNLFSDYDQMEFQVFTLARTAASYLWLKHTYQAYQPGTVLASRVSGTQIPASNQNVTYEAGSRGGTAPYTYRWYRNDAYIGTGLSYTTNAGTTDFTVKMVVTDGVSSTASTTLRIDVDGIRASVSGPGLVYLSQGDGEWTASATAGTGSYTYEWYVDNEWVGSGPVWSGYPGQGPHVLRVDVTDSAGAQHYATTEVQGIGDPNEACQPVPPQVVCNTSG
jgi:hypothetical protein